MDEVGVNLAERDQRPGLPVFDCSEFCEEGRAVTFDGAARIVLGKPEVEGVSTVSPGNAAQPRAEPVDEPRKAREWIGMKNR